MGVEVLVHDPYLRVVWTVIAACLVVLAWRSFDPVAPAFAADTMECRFSGPLEIRSLPAIEIRSVPSEFEVEVKAPYGAAGSSASNPLYVRQSQ